MPEAIETAYVAIRPDTRGFAGETRRQVKRDLIPNVGIRGPAIRGLLSVGTQLTGITAAAAGMTVALRAGFNEFKEGQVVAAQTNAVLKSTQGVAGVTATHVGELADSLHRLSGVDDEAIQAGENLILTFKNVRNVGEGVDAIFDRASKAAVDLSTAGFGSINSTAKQMGKALNDPIKGMTALSRSGVTFTAAQKATIKAMVENNNVLGAQRLILKEVESQVGGSAEAFGQTLPGALGRLSNSFSELIASGIARFGPQLAQGANAAADFFNELRDGGGAANDIQNALDAVGNAVRPLFAALRQEGPRIRSIFEDLRDIVRQAMPMLKVLGVVIGVTLVVAFKIAIRQIQLMVKVWKVVSDAIREGVQLIISALDKLLGAASFVGNALNTILPGDPFAGATDSIDNARQHLQDFNKELDNTDGRQANVTVTVTTENTPKFAAPPDAGLDPNATKGTGVEPPGPRQQRETVLQNTLTLAHSTEQTLADDKAALRALIAFYTESVKLARERGVGTRKYQAQINEAQNELNQIGRDAAQASRDAAEDAKNAAADRAAAALEERRSTLEANVRIAALTENTLRDDKIAYAKLIGFLKERVAAAKAAHEGVRAAQAELKQARKDLADLIRDAAETKLDERETLLQGAVTLASFTERKSDDERALRNLIAFYRKRIKDEKLTRVERQKYRIELARTRKDLRELREEEGETAQQGASFGRLSFDFLQKLQGFSSTLASNINPRGFQAGLTEALVTARQNAVSAAAPPTAAEQTRLDRGTRLPEEHGRGVLAPRGKDAATAALEHREQMQGPATAAQFERLLSTAQAQLRILRRIAQDQDHPEAKFNKKQSSAAVVVGVS